MATVAEREHAHELIDRIPPDQIVAAIRFLEFLLLDPVSRALVTTPVEDEEISDEEEQAVARSKEWFEHNEGVPFEQVVKELGFTINQIRNHAPDQADSET